MPDYSVQQRGLDSSNRPIRSTARCWAVWDQCVEALGFTPTIVQGGWVGDTGAAASAGTHAGDAFDLRLWDRNNAEREAMIRVFRAHGFAYWERYESQNFDLHAHMIPGPWARAGAGAAYQWQDYLTARDGLANHGPDYHWRPSPLVLTPPVPKGLVMDKDVKAAFDKLTSEVGDVRKAISDLRKKEAGRFKTEIQELRDQGLTADQILERVTADA